MLMAFVSTIALILAAGPQLQAGPVADADRPPAESEQVDTPVLEQAQTEPVEPEVISEDMAEPGSSEPVTAVESAMDVEQDDSTRAVDPQPTLEPIEDEAETEIQPRPVEPAPAVRNGEVPQTDWPGILAKASTALGSAKSAKGKFIQSNSDGTVVTGSFALNRPGRMRFDYDDPTPILIVSNGATVAMQDTELETIDRIPIGSTPLGLILSTNLNVDDDLEVLSVLQNDQRIGIRVSDATGELEGTLTMVFDKESYDLLGWLAVDGNLQTTVVDLVDVETNVRIDPRLFRLEEDEDEEDER